ncbi:MAG: mechanosensitive ion channel family protein [Gammaproteobacteria bacterium]|jgi:small-conductance mechanosensitive channel|nr:mechanosensitive ion channel family protein [Gammaproteobacteria bacterium]
MNFSDLIDNFKDTHPVIFSLLIVVLVITLASLLQVIMSYVIAKFSRKYNSKVLPALTKRFRVPVLLLSIIFGMSLATPLIRFPASTQGFIERIFSIAGIVAVTWLLVNFVDIARTLILMRYDLKASDNFKARKVYTELKVISRIINAFIMILAFAAILMTFDRIREVGYSILASAGVGAAIIGFAAQKSLATILAGLQVAMTQPIRIDDVVIVENEWGIVEEITLNYVVLRIWDKRRLIIPITYFLEKPFQNWSRQSTDLVGIVFIYTDYYVPVDELRSELTKILADNPKWDRQANVLQITDAKPDVVELRILVSASNAAKLWDLRCEVREQLINYIRQNYPESLPRTRVSLLEKKSATDIPVVKEELSHE